MREWKKVKLVDICDIRSGKRLPKGTDFSTVPTNYKYIRARDIKNGIINGENLAYITKDVKDKISNYIVNANDIAITIVGASVGDVAYVSPEFDGINLTENAVRLTNFKDNTNPRFIFYILNSPEYYLLMQQIAGGAAQPKMGIYKVEAIEVCIPSIFDQNRIVDILSRYDSLVENYQKQIKLLEEAAQRLYKEWFVDLRFPGHENTKIVDGVPEGWEKNCIAELGTVITGKTPSTSKRENYGGSIPFITIPDMHSGIFPVSSQFLSDIGANSQKGKFIPADSLMVSCIGTAGLVCISSRTCQTNQQINSLVLHDKRFLYFLYYAFLMLKEHLNNIGSNGATMTNVNKSKFESISLLIPTGNLISLYNDKAKPYFKNIRQLSSQIRHLTEARDRLLPKLMSGEIAV